MLQQAQSFGDAKGSDQLFYTRKENARKADQLMLRFELDRAMTVGNLYNEPTLIKYMDSSGVECQKEEVVQAVTIRHIIFKGGEMLPIHSISKVVL